MVGRLHRALALLLPAACALCRRPLGAGIDAGGVCRGCWDTVLRHGDSCCSRCGDPEADGPGPCLTCRSTPPPWHAATSVGPYTGTLRELILLLKNARRDELAPPLAELAVAAWRRTGWAVPDVVTPVPSSWLRELRRGYNQAELLSREVAVRLGAWHRRALRRRGAGTQRGRSRRSRLALPAATFTARGVAMGTVLLVDDVLTTGATVGACTRALLRAGSVEVRVLTLARTPPPRSFA